jgi:hypothetical protein
MPLRSKKTQERRGLKLFQEAFADFPTGRVVEWATPDFLIRSASSYIGIEVAEIFLADAVASGPGDGAELLQKIFDRNSPTYQESRANCDQVWLLLVTSDEGVVNCRDEPYSHVYQTAFDRAFLLENGHKLTELKAHRPQAS